MTGDPTVSTTVEARREGSGLPDPSREIRMTSLHATRGANYWSSRPVTRLDLAVGEYEHISTAQATWCTDLLLGAMPGLEEHRCSIGERGGFVIRLRRGTYAPHIIEHVALELQTMIGHDVGYGRSRGGDEDGEYTVIMEHRHDAVGMRAAALAVEAVCQAFDGSLRSVAHAVEELAALAASPCTEPIRQRVLCGITGGDARAETRAELTRLAGADELIIDVAPGYILQAGLPYAEATMAIVLDAEPLDVPERYRETDRARRLVSVVADPVVRDGFAIVPAKEWEVQDMARDAGCRVAVFTIDADITARDTMVACAAAFVDGGRIIVERREQRCDLGAVRDGTPVQAQVAASLAALLLREGGPETSA